MKSKEEIEALYGVLEKHRFKYPGQDKNSYNIGSEEIKSNVITSWGSNSTEEKKGDSNAELARNQ